MTDIVDRLNDSLSAGYSELRKEAALEIERLRAKIAEMEKQVPICRAEDLRHAEILLPSLGLMPEDKLYALPGAKAQNATSVPSEEDESVRKAWSRFSNELHRGPDAPYPGMSEAFEQHFSQSFTDRDWRAESGTWAAAWKAAKRHGAQPAPNAVAYLDLGVGGYMDIGTDLTDEELATLPKGRHMLGIIGTYGVDGYVPAQPAPSVREGWKLVPIEPTEDMLRAMTDPFVAINGDNRKAFESAYTAMLAAAPKPEATP